MNKENINSIALIAIGVVILTVLAFAVVTVVCLAKVMFGVF